VPSSAADHEWVALRVDIWPSRGQARGAVYLRRSRGTDLVWQRHLLRPGVSLSDGANVDSLAGALRVAGEALLQAADDALGASSTRI